MFVQVIQGKTSNPQALDTALNTWVQDLAPGATGWLGSTSGVTEDGRAIAVVRFDSEDDARRNSNRPEQDQWWSETAKLFDGDATFQDSTDVTRRRFRAIQIKPASCRSCRARAAIRYGPVS